MYMNLPNLLFYNEGNYLQWCNHHSNNSNSTLDDLMVDELLQYIKAEAEDFPEEYLYKPCYCIEDAKYRLNIMEEVYSSPVLYRRLSDFIISLRSLINKLDEYRKTKEIRQKQYRFLTLFCIFKTLLTDLISILSECESEGLSALRNYADKKLQEDYAIQFNQALILNDEISHIFKNITLSINPNKKTLTINKSDGRQDATLRLSALIKEYFGVEINESFSIVDPAPLSVLEIKMLDLLSSQNADVFMRLNNFCVENTNLYDTIVDFSELYSQFLFYITFTKFLFDCSNSGIHICKPVFNNEFIAKDCACLTLAAKLLTDRSSLDESVSNNVVSKEIVCNDIAIGKGGMFLLSGPNQGGKTVYLRTVGLTSYLSKCGCLVLGRSCQLPFYDNISTHFMQKEVLGLGRLAVEAKRMEGIIDILTDNSLLLMNESFASTRRKDGIEISLYYLNKLKSIGCSVGFVSHYYEIPELLNATGHCITSLRTGITKDGERTYQVFEDHGNEMVYARDIALRCKMSYEQIIYMLREEGLC
ncbi:MAG: hypothetical protein GX288_03920 [Clostridiales bacterium]|nr:hypothetical protein [Clostridiales bacterium]